MKNPITKLATAAVIIIAVLASIDYFGGSIDGTSIAWADVVEQIRTFHPYSYTSTVQDKGKPPVTSRKMILSPTRRREVYPDGYTQVFDLSQQPVKMLYLHPDKKLAIEKTSANIKPGRGFDLLRHLCAFESMPDKFTVEDLGVRQVEGRTAKGFHVPGEYNDWTIWADAQSGLPIRIELKHLQLRQTIIMTEFGFDIDFDESLFSTTAPKGYTVKKVVDPTEQDLIDGLRSVAKFLGGEFPPVFELKGLQKILGKYIEQNNLSPSKDQMHSFGKKLSPATKYFARLNSNKDFFKFSYVGRGVKLGDADTPILWYRPEGSETYRVIYGDLTVKDVEPENLPE